MLYTQLSDSLWPRGLQPTRLLCPWNFPGKTIGVGCHFLLQGILPSQELSLASSALAGRFFNHCAAWKAHFLLLIWNSEKVIWWGLRGDGYVTVFLGNVSGICPNSRLGSKTCKQEGRGHDLGCSLLRFFPAHNPQKYLPGPLIRYKFSLKQIRERFFQQDITARSLKTSNKELYMLFNVFKPPNILMKRRVMNFAKCYISDYKYIQFSCSVVSDSLWRHGLQHTRPHCPSPTPGIYSNSCPSHRWCHPTISSSVVPFSHLQSFPASGSFPMSLFFALGGQSIRVSDSASVLPMNIQDWFPLRWIGCSSRDFQESSPALQFKSINSLALSFLYGPTLTSIHDYWESHSFD